MDTALTVAAVVLGVPGALTALHLATMAVASLAYRERRRHGAGDDLRLLVVLPAHDEELVIGDTLRALLADLRPQDAVLVVADRCTDATADIARSAGALVLERGPGEEPGRAAARQAGIRYAASLEWDALCMVDADSIVEPGFRDACADAIAAGAPAVQARSEAAIGDRLLDHTALAASSIQGIVLPRGRDRLGLLVRLRGTGMVLRRDVVESFRFRAPASEDLWFSLDMCLAGLRPRHVESGRLRSLSVSSWDDAADQRVRYEAGRMSAAREFVGRLLRQRSKASLEAALFLLSPPFAVAALLLVLAGALAAVAGATAVTVTAVAGIALLAFALGVGLVGAGATPRTWLALAVAPWYLPWKAVVQVRALLSLGRGRTDYGATPRA